MVKIEINNTTRIKVSEKFIKEIIKKACKFLKIKDKEISLSFVNGDEIKKLNKIYRNKNSVTDVLSFAEEDFHAKWPYEKENFLGEIIICLEQIKKQAKEFNNSFYKEITIILIHSLLHLIGYEHSDKMRNIEKETLKNILTSLSLPAS